MFKLGLIVNPVAGLGGSVALKGSDNVSEQALALGAVPKAGVRAGEALSILLSYQEHIEIYTASGDMGENLAREMGFAHSVCYVPDTWPSQARDTENAVSVLMAKDVDLILFAGGDGTARNICAVAEDKVPVLGIPAGVKIHSGVYAVTPKAAGKVVEKLVNGELVSLGEADVMDIDEALFREGKVKAKRYGEMQVPRELEYVQSVKMGGIESEELVLNDLAAHVIDEMDDELYIMGSGSTVDFVMQELGLDNTLLGVDAVYEQGLVGQDLSAQALEKLVDEYSNVRLVITLIGGQGHVFGRGNQQLSPEVIRKIGKDNIILLATKAKLASLQGRPLIADTGDSQLNKELSGLIKVVTGYKDYVMYALASPGEE